MHFKLSAGRLPRTDTCEKSGAAGSRSPASSWFSGSTRICLSISFKELELLSHGRMAAQCCPSELSCQQTTDWRFCDEELQICLGPLNQSNDKLILGETSHSVHMQSGC